MAGTLIKPIQDAINARRASRRHVHYRFPSDIGAHCMVLNFKEYSFDATQTAITGINPQSSIVLPLPNNLQDTFTMNADQAPLGIGGALISNALGGSGKMDPNDVTSVVKGIGKDAFNMATSLFTQDGEFQQHNEFAAYAKYIARSAVDMLPAGAGFAIDAATATAINPHLSVNFDGVTLKQHSFTWTFAPKSEEESDLLRDIQYAIRRAILPRYQALGDAVGGALAPTQRALLKYPNLVDIFMLGIDQDYYYHFKPAMVKQFDMNFTGGGQSPAILRGGKPAIVTMNLQLQESQIHTSEDYGGESQTITSTSNFTSVGG